MAKDVIAALEISSSAVKLVVGYELEGEVIILGSIRNPISNVVKDAEIFDFVGANQAIVATIKQLSNELNMTINEVVLAIPPLGFEVYSQDEQTRVVSSEIASIDIENVISLVRKIGISDTSEIVDVIPNEYVLDNGMTYTEAPLGASSDTLGIHTKIHTLPKYIVQNYKKAIINSGLKIRKIVVSPYAITELLKNDKEVPDNYILVDIGAELTTLSFIGNKEIYSSTYFHRGFDHLTKNIADTLKIPAKTANELKEKYGFDNRIYSFDVPIISVINQEGITTNYRLSDLKNIITNFVMEYNDELRNARAELLHQLDSRSTNWPVIIVGGGALLNGLKHLLDHLGTFGKVKIAYPRSLGARHPSFITCLGMIKLTSARTEFSDSSQRVTPLGRENSRRNKKLNRQLSEYEDDL